ncbi:hypothetical protein [Anthocerotibacter panamensis]|uniref:hypothetical protein n=1 Tax=Anthocerotibacter panamensis TaxID=2857077 RepID=UPI001C40304B|nr:hypothetical protein [Anthocerotibacter panamensis]
MKTLAALLLGSVLLTSTPVWAQLAPANSRDLSGGSTSGSQDNPFGTGGNGLDVFSLVHRSNLANPTTPKQFNKESQETLDDEVAKFRSRNVLKITPALVRPENNQTPAPTPPSP